MFCIIKKTVKQLFIFLIFIFSFIAFTLPPQYSENEIKAMYILKFIRYTYWQENKDKEKDIYIGVYGKTVVTKYLKKFLLLNNKENKNVKVKIIKKIDNIKDCDILFVSSLTNREVDNVVEKLNNSPVLTISDNKKFLEKGIMINLFPKGRKVVYSINKVSVDKAEIKLSPKIYSLAIMVKQKND